MYLSGWIKLHRSIIDSDIYQMPPLYLRVFERLILEANHQDNEIPYKERGSKLVGKKLIKRGERLTSVRDICKWVSWYERGKLKEPNPKTVQDILDWLEENDMIFIYGEKGNRKETHYKIVNYSIYQTREDEEVTEDKQPSNSKITEKKQSLETNKNDKECKEVSVCMYGENENLKNIIKLLEENIGIIPPILIEEVNNYTDIFDIEMFSEAIKIAANNKRRSVNYVLGILRNWKDNNILTIDDLEALRKEKEIERQEKQQYQDKKQYPKPKKTRFHNFEQRTSNMTEDELEAIVRRKREEYFNRVREG